jgi:hypothetical protein
MSGYRQHLDRGEQLSARAKWASADFSVRAFPLPHQHHREHNRHQQDESASNRRCSHPKPCHGLLRQKWKREFRAVGFLLLFVACTGMQMMQMPCLRPATFLISFALLRLPSCASVKQMSWRAAGRGSAQTAPFKVGYNAGVATVGRSADPVTRHSRRSDRRLGVALERKKTLSRTGAWGRSGANSFGVGPRRAQQKAPRSGSRGVCRDYRGKHLFLC